jgi:hypothetical protein
MAALFRMKLNIGTINFNTFNIEMFQVKIIYEFSKWDHAPIYFIVRK